MCTKYARVMLTRTMVPATALTIRSLMLICFRIFLYVFVFGKWRLFGILCRRVPGSPGRCRTSAANRSLELNCLCFASYKLAKLIALQEVQKPGLESRFHFQHCTS